MTHRLLAASLAALVLVSPALALAQDETTSTYSDTFPKHPHAQASHAAKAKPVHARKPTPTKKLKRSASAR